MSNSTKASLSNPTRILFHIAAHSHTLRETFGIEFEEPENGKFTFASIPRPWLIPHPIRQDEYTFDPDRFATLLQACSDGQRHMFLWILNVWNESYAKSKGWQFDMFKAINSLDKGNRDAIARWLQHPVWP
jgi:hypothetical protein